MKSFILLLCVTMAACISNDGLEELASLDTDRLDNFWAHSMEEDSNSDTQIFRPCDYKNFPASRFRMTMTKIKHIK